MYLDTWGLAPQSVGQYVSATLATILASHGAIAATGKPQYEVTQRRVSFADLDVTRSAGAVAL